MSPTALERALSVMSDDTMVPVRWVKEQLGGDSLLDGLTVEEIAERLDLSVTRVREFIHEIPGARKVGRRWRAPENGVEAWLRGERA